MAHFDKNEIAERFIRYAAIFTQSEEGVADTPSTPVQRDLARVLTRELQDMGAADVVFDEEKCYVYATIPGNIPTDPEKVAKIPDAQKKRRENTAPILGLVAHMDTSASVDGRGIGIHPRLIPSYDGGEIVLNEELGIRMSEEDYPDLATKEGKMLVVTDGRSVLGGDDKAGVTQIMEVADFFLHHPEIAHGTIRIMFTPDEEVGNGVMNFDPEQFAVDYGYTIDGSRVGDMEFDNFNAASLHVDIKGKSTHPGDAYHSMRNALLVAMEYNALLPKKETPYHTKDREGFFHVDEMSGTTDHATMEYIIRDHDREKFEARKALAKAAADKLNSQYGEGVVTVTIKDSYYNMLEKIRPQMHLIENAREATRALGIEPVDVPIRGGTDGCTLSYRGIPCPNLGTGAYNYHSRYEYVCVDEMELGAEILLRIMNKYAGFEIDIA